MDNYQQNLQEEMVYLEKTVAFIRRELEVEAEGLSDTKRELIASRKDMWENTVHFSNDFARLTEINQYLSEVTNQTANYENKFKNVEKYKRIIGSPYFGRFDFVEDGCDNPEKIYIGLYNVMDPKTHSIYVYDWRAPVSSIFYRYELGKATYNAPVGTITGDVLLKRQYKIQNSKLKYFFDSSIRINDEILQEILSRNSSAKMRNIVETIQKEQDMIIRDTDNELLIVQGVAGSGKTSIALHRVAFLLYDGLSSKLGSNNVIIISPNAVFSKYISSVLPELGEENVEQTTFDDIVSNVFKDKLVVETRDMLLESMINSRNDIEGNVRRHSIDFKGSKTFVQILERFLWHYKHRIIAFEDVYFNGIILETRQQLKNRFLNNKIGIPMAKQLKRIENMILEKVHPLQKKRLERLEKIVQKSEGHDLEIKSFSRLLSIKKTRSFLSRLYKFTKVDYWDLYKMLFNEQGLLFKLAQGLELPGDFEQIISTTKQRLEKGQVNYEDYAPLLYLRLRIEGSDMFSEIRQVVIDEAQDYYPLQYEVFKLIFKEAKYTVLGDIHQTIEREADSSLYDDVSEILNKQKTSKLFINKGYRSSYEINTFTQKLLGLKQDFIPFERHEKEPMVVYKKTTELIDRAIIRDIASYIEQGYESMAVICKTQQEAEIVHSKLKNLIKIKLIKPHDGTVEKGVSVIPAYMAKGLEFDVVMVYCADKGNYSSEFDRKLLYVACTRALHRLVLYYTGAKSPFI
ncbi:MAG: HelD family protein [Eubacteriales bacterium]